MKQKQNVKEKRASLPDNKIDYIAIDHSKSSSLANLEKEGAKFLLIIKQIDFKILGTKNFAPNDEPETTDKSR